MFVELRISRLQLVFKTTSLSPTGLNGFDDIALIESLYMHSDSVLLSVSINSGDLMYLIIWSDTKLIQRS